MAKKDKTSKALLRNRQEAYKDIHGKGTSGGGPARRRSCLRCGKLFNSIGRGNRLCPSCRGSNLEEHRRPVRVRNGIPSEGEAP